MAQVVETVNPVASRSNSAAAGASPWQGMRRNGADVEAGDQCTSPARRLQLTPRKMALALFAVGFVGVAVGAVVAGFVVSSTRNNVNEPAAATANIRLVSQGSHSLEKLIHMSTRVTKTNYTHSMSTKPAAHRQLFGAALTPSGAGAIVKIGQFLMQLWDHEKGKITVDTSNFAGAMPAEAQGNWDSMKWANAMSMEQSHTLAWPGVVWGVYAKFEFKASWVCGGTMDGVSGTFVKDVGIPESDGYVYEGESMTASVQFEEPYFDENMFARIKGTVTVQDQGLSSTGTKTASFVVSADCNYEPTVDIMG